MPRPARPAPLVLAVGLAVDRATTPFAVAGRTIPHHALNLVAAGGGAFAGEDRREDAVGAGDLLSLHPGRWHRFGPAPGTRWTEYWAIYDAGAVAARLGPELLPPPGRWSGGSEAPRWYDELHGLWLGRPPGWQARADLALHAILVQAWRLRAGDASPARDDLVGRTCGWLREDLADPGRTLAACARREGLSAERLRKRFRAALGVPPGAWLLSLRLRIAQDLLLGGARDIQDVARAVGFADPFHFSRIFRRHVGVPPREFRRRGGGLGAG